MTTVPFSYDTLTSLFPAFGVGGQFFTPEPKACLYFGMAGLYCNNSDCSLVPADPTTYQPRNFILYMLTCHLLAINGATQSGAAGLVGQITDASEGSVSIKLNLNAPPGTAAWYEQTPWGLEAYQAMAPYRTARYIPNPGRFAQIGYGRFGGFR